MRYRDAHHFDLRKVKLPVDQARAILFERKHGVISESVFAAPNRHLATNKGDLRAVPVYFSFGNQPIDLTFRKRDPNFAATIFLASTGCEYEHKIRSAEAATSTHSANRPHRGISWAYRRFILPSLRLMETTMFNLTREFALLTLSGALLACGSNLSSASAGSAAVDADANGSTKQQEPTGASRPGPFACPAEVLTIMAKALKEASMTDATVLDGQEPSTGSTPEERYFTYPVSFPD